jgi:hypothetical protein
MNKQRIKELRTELEEERISQDSLLEIEGAFAEIPDSQLRDHRENAMASDMLDELEAYTTAAKHTPGPWEYRINPNDDYTEEVIAGALCVARCGGGPLAQANARLIASAPDLLEFCGIVNELADSSADFLTNFDDASDEMRAVAEGLATLAMAARDLIRKATGE